MKHLKPLFMAALALAAMCLHSGLLQAQAQTNGPGQAVNLNGVDGYIQAPPGVWFNGPFTVEGWVNVRSYNHWSRLIDFANGEYLHNVYLAVSANTGGNPTMGIFNNADAPLVGATQQLVLNQWVHLAATYNGTVGTIYFNGTNVGSGNLVVPPPNVTRTNNYIGRSAWAHDAYANALFDELRIWKVARTQPQIASTMRYSLPPSDTNLIANWRFNEGAGTQAADSSSYGRTGTLSGGVMWTNSTAPIISGFGNAVNLDLGQHVEVAHHSSLNAYPLTIMTWFKTTQEGGALMNKYNSGSYNGYQMFIGGGGQLQGWFLRNNANTIFMGTSGAPPANDGQWHHAAFTVDASGGKLYLDGVLRGTAPWTGAPGTVTGSQPLTLGLYQGDSFIAGQFDEASVWNAALSADQIRLYAIRGLVGTEPNLFAYYRLDEGTGTFTADASGRGRNGSLRGGATWIPSLPQPAFTARTLDANAITTTSALLNGAVNPNGLNTTAWFEYGTTTNYGSVSVANNFTAGFLLEKPLTLAVTDLQLSLTGRLYHFRLVATNSEGVAVGEDRTFVTAEGSPTVTSLADDGNGGSLRQLIANLPDGSTITFATNGTITLTNGEILVTKSFTIIGPGPTNLIISGNNNGRVFRFAADVTNTISGLTIRDGKATGDLDGAGGGVHNAGTLILSNCVVSDNQAAPGAPGTTTGSFPVTTSHPGSPGKVGGGIFNSGTLRLIRCHFFNNAGGTGGPGVSYDISALRFASRGGAGGDCGAIYNTGQATAFACTFNANAGGRGGDGGHGAGAFNFLGESGGDGGSFGVIYNTGVFTLTLCTVDSNVGGAPGANYSGGLPGSSTSPPGVAGANACIFNSGTITFLASTVTRNTAGGVLNTWFATARSSLFARNGSSYQFDYHGPFSSQGHNLIGNNDGSFGFFPYSNNDVVGTPESPIDPLIAPLADNGGGLLTVALLPGSPALDAGDDLLLASPFNLSTDQRRQPRKSGAHVDIGAVEVLLINAPLLSEAAVTLNGQFRFTFTNAPQTPFTVYSTTNLALPLTNWTMLSAPVELSPGLYQFLQTLETNAPARFYQVRSP